MAALGGKPIFCSQNGGLKVEMRQMKERRRRQVANRPGGLPPLK
jgi:hypothetical protein